MLLTNFMKFYFAINQFTPPYHDPKLKTLFSGKTHPEGLPGLCPPIGSGARFPETEHWSRRASPKSVQAIMTVL